MLARAVVDQPEYACGLGMRSVLGQMLASQSGFGAQWSSVIATSGAAAAAYPACRSA